MNLSTVKRSDFPAARVGNTKPILSVSGKSGVIAINPAAVSHFKLKNGDSVAFCKDTDSTPPEWYIVLPQGVTPSEDTFLLRKSGTRLQFSSKPLAHSILKDFLRKKDPNKKDHELNLGKYVHFKLAFEPAMNGDQEIPDTYAIMGGVIFG